jgi:hypothetical protein
VAPPSRLTWRLPSSVPAHTTPGITGDSANAVIVQVDVTGIVTGLDHHNSIMFTYAPFLDLAFGDTVTGSWIYDTSTPYGRVPISGMPLGYLIESMSFSTGGGIGGYANFSDNGLATFRLPGTGRIFPDQSEKPLLVLYVNQFFVRAGFNANDDRIRGGARRNRHDRFLNTLELSTTVLRDKDLSRCFNTNNNQED